MKPVISVSIGSFNRRDSLLRAIDALAASELRKPFELCVVLDGCTDGSDAAVASRFSELPEKIFPVLKILPRNIGIGAVHQVAIENTTAPISVFIDDDCVSNSDFLPRILAGFSTHPTAVGYGGFVRSYSHDTLNRRFLDARDPHRPTEADFIDATFLQRVRFAIQPPQHSGIRPVYSLVGGAMAFRRDAVIAVGGFPSIRFGGTETALCEALRKGFGNSCLLADPSIVVAHEFHPDLRGTFRRALRAGVAHGRDFIWRGGVPTIPPNPLFVGATAIVGWMFAPAVAVLLSLGVLVLLFGRVARAHLPESLVYPFLWCIEDGLKGIGFLVGAWRYRREWHKEAVV